jgi:pyrophosphatase PpaX
VPRRYDAVLFDLDGTVLDSHGLILASWRHVRDTFGLTGDDAAFQAEIGRPLVSIFERWATDAAHRDALVAAYREHNDRVHDAMVVAFPGIAALLGALAAQGVALAVVTSKSRSFALRGLRVGGLSDRFGTIVAADDTVLHKPHPEPVHRALDAVGVSASRALMVGDAAYDILAGHAAGTDTAGVTWGGSTAAQLRAAGADHLVSTPAELAALCGLL